MAIRNRPQGFPCRDVPGINVTPTPAQGRTIQPCQCLGSSKDPTPSSRPLLAPSREDFSLWKRSLAHGQRQSRILSWVESSKWQQQPLPSCCPHGRSHSHFQAQLRDLSPFSFSRALDFLSLLPFFFFLSLFPPAYLFLLFSFSLFSFFSPPTSLCSLCSSSII